MIDAGFLWLTGILALGFLLLILRRRGTGFPYLVLFSIFWIYSMFAVAETLFPIFFPDTGGFKSSPASILSQVNLVPFSYLARLDQLHIRVFILEISLNILLTIPFGFGLRFIARVPSRNFFWLGPVVGLAIESAQLAISLVAGLAYRTVDITDVLLNAVGVWIGFLLFRVFAWTFGRLTRGREVKDGGLAAYVRDVARS